MGIKWTIEEREYIAEITSGRHYREIKELMENKFKREYTLSQIKGAIGRYKLNTGFNGQFNKGHVPFNQGQKGVCAPGCKKSWFKKGHAPVNHRPVGSERVNVEGYIEIKIAEPNKWGLKHRVIYKKHYGDIDRNTSVIFADGNKQNLDIENLIAVSRNKLLVMNKHKLIKSNAEATKTGTIVADVILRIREKKGN